MNNDKLSSVALADLFGKIYKILVIATRYFLKTVHILHWNVVRQNKFTFHYMFWCQMECTQLHNCEINWCQAL